MSFNGVLDFCDIIYGAALDDAQWQRAMTQITEQFPFTLPALVFYDGWVDGGQLQSFTEIDSQLMQSYGEHYASVNPWVSINMTTPVGSVTKSSDFLPISDLRNTEFYNDWLRHAEGVDEALGSTLFREDDRLALFGVHCKSETTNSDDVEALRRLLMHVAPHIQRAIALRRQFAGSKLYSTTLEAALDLLETPMMIASGNGQIRFANAAAEKLLGQDDYPLYSYHGQLSVSHVQLNDELRSSLRVATGVRYSFTETHNNTLRMPVADKLFHLINVFPLTANLPHHTDVARNATLVQRHALVSIINPDARTKTPEATVLIALGLTLAEARLAIAAANGVTLRDFADERGVSFNTTRSQMKSILDKLGLNRQSQLTALMARSFGHFVER